MEHFCALAIFHGLFFQLFGHSVCVNSYRKTDILQNRRRYIQNNYEDNRQRKIARTKVNYSAIFRDNQAHVKTKFKVLFHDNFQDGNSHYKNKFYYLSSEYNSPTNNNKNWYAVICTYTRTYNTSALVRTLLTSSTQSR